MRVPVAALTGLSANYTLTLLYCLLVFLPRRLRIWLLALYVGGSAQEVR